MSDSRRNPDGLLDYAEQTPSRPTNTTPKAVPGEQQDLDIPETASESKFDSIASHVNSAIAALNDTYSAIGYSSTEARIKKAEIFTALEDTISNFSSSLLREKNNIENECEWLRQQIRIILAMVNDDKGDKTLRASDRGIVFDDKSLYEVGYKEDVVDRLEYLQSHRQSFYAASPFNLTSPYIPETDVSPTLENQYDYMTKTIPQLSLLQLKVNLNRIFLDVLQSFMKPFRKLTELNVAFLDILEVVGSLSDREDTTLLKSLSTREETDNHAQLIHDFESTLDKYRESKSSRDTIHDSTQYIISSPRKNQLADPQLTDSKSKEAIDELRETNYRIIRTIRSLRITRITTELFTKLQRMTNSYMAVMAERKDQMSALISRCLELISDLLLNEKQLQLIQKNISTQSDPDDSQQTSNEGYFDVETLQFIRNNPTEFGLHDGHLKFVDRFASTLERLHESKRKKMAHYVETCKNLWERLDESDIYISEFLSANSDLSEASFINFKMELNRLYIKRSEYVDEFIAKARSQIEDLWNTMLYSSEMRQSFKYFEYDAETNNDDREEVLNCHESELSLLKKDYEERAQILDLYSQAQELAKDQQFLVESSKDSSRLLSKNSCKILLNEERIRKNLSRNMPRLINTLKAEVIKFNNILLSQNKKPLQAYGEDFFEMVLMFEAEHVQKRAEKTRVNTSPAKTLSPKRVTSNKPVPKAAPRSPSRVFKPEVSPPKRTGVPKPARASKFSRNSIMSDRLTSAVNSMSSFSESSNSGSPGQRLSFFARNTSMPRQLQPLNSPLKAEESCISQSTMRMSPLQPSSTANTTAKDRFEKDKLSLSPTIRDIVLKLGVVLNAIEKESSKENRGKHCSQQDDMSHGSSILISDDYQSWRDQRIRQLNGTS